MPIPDRQKSAARGHPTKLRVSPPELSLGTPLNNSTLVSNSITLIADRNMRLSGKLAAQAVTLGSAFPDSALRNSETTLIFGVI
ncbi:MAG TPA: hypothetical protein PKG49_08265 [Nitrosomonas mobilis]|nr:hypothetical protein [Nitrosomonas mobilis]